MNTINKKLVSMLAFALTYSTVVSQSSEDNILDSSKKSLVRLYDQSIGGDSRLYNGPEYNDHFEKKTLDGSTFFLSEDWQSGSINYDGQFYENIPILFDIYLDRIIVEHPKDYRKIELVTEKVNFFTLNNQLFIRLQSPSKGFFQQIYSGEIKIYKKHIKAIQEKTGAKSMITSFIDKEKIYILKSNKFFLVNSKSSALKILSERRSELNSYLRDENVSFRKNKESALLKMGEYFDKLNSSK